MAHRASIVAALIALAAAQLFVTTPSGSAAGGSTGGVITGRVLPVGDTTWRGARVPVRADRLVDGEWRDVFEAVADDAGRYRMDDLPPGTYRVHVHVLSMSNTWAYHDVDPADDDVFTSFPVAGGRVTDGIDVQVDLGAVIAGRVRDDRGRPVAGVAVHRLSFAGSGPSCTCGTTTFTDRDGRYVIRRLTAGVHRLLLDARDGVHVDQVWPRGDVRDRGRAVDIVVGSHDAVGGVDGVLPVGGSVSGVLAVPQQDLEGYQIAILYRRAGAAWVLAEASAVRDGRFRVGGVADGTYVLCFSRATSGPATACLGGPHPDTATPLVLAAGTVVRRDLRGDGLGSIVGTVTAGSLADGEHFPDGNSNLVVNAYRVTTRGYELAGGAVSDLDGRYEMRWLAPGRYRVAFVYSHPEHGTQEFWPDAGSLEEATDAVVRPGGNTVADAVLDAGGQITGTFLDEDGDGENALVTAYRRAPDGGWRRVASGQLGLGERGYAVTGLRPGTYRLGFGADPQWYARSVPVFWPASPTLAAASDIVVGSLGATVVGKDVDVDPGSVIEGTVRGLDGHVYTGGEVVAYRRVGGRWVEERRTRSTHRLGGGYALAGLPAGTYRVALRDDPTFWAPAFHGPGTPRRFADATDIVLRADELVGHVDLAPSGQVRNPVRGRVTGRARVGALLRLRPGTWSPTGTRLHHQWYVGGRPVSGAHGTTYRVRPRDRGKRVNVVTTGRRDGRWAPLSARTPPTAPVGRR